MGTNGTSRRRFLGTAAGATGVALGAAIWGSERAAAALPASDGAADPNPLAGRGYTPGRFALDIGGTAAGWIQDVEGGHATADVVNEKQGTDYIVHKHIGNVKYEDITMQVGFSMSKAVYDWIAASWSMNYQRKDGAIHAADFDYKARATRQFYQGLITETTIPACDGSSKDPAYLAIRFAPEYTRVVKASGKVDAPAQKQKQWLPSNFRLQIDGLDCTHVSKIEALTVKQKVVENPVGDERDYNKEPASIEFPNLVVTTQQSHAQSWYDWHEDFVIKGNCTDDREKTGSLTFLTQDLKNELARIDFFGLGIFKTSDDALDTDGTPGMVTFSMYCERMVFTYLGGGGGTQPSPSPTPAP